MTKELDEFTAFCKKYRILDTMPMYMLWEDVKKTEAKNTELVRDLAQVRYALEQSEKLLARELRKSADSRRV